MATDLGFDSDITSINNITGNAVGWASDVRDFIRKFQSASASNPFGSAAKADTGTGSGNVPVLDASGDLAASTIPNLPVSILTSGTLGLARGGTGVTTYAALTAALGLDHVYAWNQRVNTNLSSSAVAQDAGIDLSDFDDDKFIRVTYTPSSGADAANYGFATFRKSELNAVANRSVGQHLFGGSGSIQLTNAAAARNYRIGKDASGNVLFDTQAVAGVLLIQDSVNTLDSTQLIDMPSAADRTAAAAGQVLALNTAKDGYVLSAASAGGVSAWTALTGTPGTYGSSGQLLRSTGTALEWFTHSFLTASSNLSATRLTSGAIPNSDRLATRPTATAVLEADVNGNMQWDTGYLRVTAAPAANQILRATSSTAYSWWTPNYLTSSSNLNASNLASGTVGAARLASSPAANRILRATSGSGTEWWTPNYLTSIPSDVLRTNSTSVRLLPAAGSGIAQRSGSTVSYGTVGIAAGGTGATTASAARLALQAAPIRTFGTPRTTDYTTTDSDDGQIIAVNSDNGNVTITLHASAQLNFEVTIVKDGSNANRVRVRAPSGGHLVGRGTAGDGDVVIDAVQDYIDLESINDGATFKKANASNWFLPEIFRLRRTEVPPGGSSGQILAKSSSTDFDTTWIPAPSGGGAATTNAADLTTGTLPGARLTSTVSTRLVPTGGTTSQYLRGGSTPAWVNANWLTSSSNLNASRLTSGTVPPARIAASPTDGQLLRISGSTADWWTHNFLTSSSSIAATQLAAGPGTNQILRYTGSAMDWWTPDYITSSNTRLMPSGGTTNQVLAKSSNTNYATQWVNAGTGWEYLAISADRTITAADNNRVIDVTTSGSSRTITLGTSPGENFYCVVRKAHATDTISFTLAFRVQVNGSTARLPSLRANGDAIHLRGASNGNWVAWYDWAVQAISAGGTGRTAGDNLVPSGGNAGQVLTKDTDTSYDFSWQSPSAPGVINGIVVLTSEDFSGIGSDFSMTPVAGWVNKVVYFNMTTAGNFSINLTTLNTAGVDGDRIEFNSNLLDPGTRVNIRATDPRDVTTELRFDSGLMPGGEGYRFTAYRINSRWYII